MATTDLVPVPTPTSEDATAATNQGPVPTAPASAVRRLGSAEPGRRADIQGLRALAVILVIADHAGVPGLGGGFLGVDVFFVISGYVITQLLLRERSKGVGRGLAEFYSRRVRRIVPAATATLVATLVVSELVLGRDLDPNLPGDVRWASLFAANWRLMTTSPGYLVAGVHPSLVTQFWSLGVEEQFYLCFPVGVFLIARLVAPPRQSSVLRAAIVVGIVASAWWSLHVSAAEPTAAYYSPFTRFWELGIGALLATTSGGPLRRTARAEYLAVTLGLALLVVALVVLGPASVYPGWLAALPCSAAAALIWAGAGGGRIGGGRIGGGRTGAAPTGAAPTGAALTGAARFLSWRPLVHVGDLSYSLYLTHFVWFVLPELLSAPLTGWPWRLVELAGTVLSALGSYHLIENPLRRSRRLAADRASVVLLLLVCVSACWAASAWAPRLATLH